MYFLWRKIWNKSIEEFPQGSHTVYAEYGLNGDLTLSSYHYGLDVEAFWGNDEYEYYLTIDKDGLSKFVIHCLAKVLTRIEVNSS